MSGFKPTPHPNPAMKVIGKIVYGGGARGRGGAHLAPKRQPRPTALVLILGVLLVAGAISSAFGAKSPNGPSAVTVGSTQFQRVAQQASKARLANELDRAIALYRQALKLNPRWDEGWWYLGTLYYDTNQYALGVDALRNLVELDPNYGPGWALLGLCEFETHDYKNSVFHLRTAVAKGLGGNIELANAVNYHRALIENMRGDFEGAQAILNSLVANGVLSEVVRFALGMALLRIPLLPNQVNPTTDAVIHQAGGVGELVALADYDQAENAFEKLVKNYPKTPFVHYAYGSMLANLARYHDAQAQFQDEIEVNPESAIAYMELALVDLHLNQDKDALPLSEKAAQLAPDSFVAHYLLGRALLAAGQVQQAVKQLETARQLGPFSPEVRYSLAQALARDHRPNAAARQRAAFVRLNAALQRVRRLQGSAGQSYRMSNSRGELAPHEGESPGQSQ